MSYIYVLYIYFVMFNQSLKFQFFLDAKYFILIYIFDCIIESMFKNIIERILEIIRLYFMIFFSFFFFLLFINENNRVQSYNFKDWNFLTVHVRLLP